MRKAIDVSRAKHEAAAKLEGILHVEGVLAEAVLPVPAGFGAFARSGIIGPEKMKHVGLSQSGGLVDLAGLVDEQGKIDLHLLTEVASIFQAA